MPYSNYRNPMYQHLQWNILEGKVKCWIIIPVLAKKTLQPQPKQKLTRHPYVESKKGYAQIFVCAA